MYRHTRCDFSHTVITWRILLITINSTRIYLMLLLFSRLQKTATSHGKSLLFFHFLCSLFVFTGKRPTGVRQEVWILFHERLKGLQKARVPTLRLFFLSSIHHSHFIPLTCTRFGTKATSYKQLATARPLTGPSPEARPATALRSQGAGYKIFPLKKQATRTYQGQRRATQPP